MKLYDVKCPFCGMINHSFYLEETDGWMECERCGQLTASCSEAFQEGSIVSGL